MARFRHHVLVVHEGGGPPRGPVAVLESWGYRASAAPDGKDALAECERDLPHGIVTDLMMPGMSGLEFVEALRERVEQVAVIFLPGQAPIETAVQAIKLGAYDYLAKPLEPQRLRSVLEKGLKHAALAREAGALRP